jgi:hypothetical protein
MQLSGYRHQILADGAHREPVSDDLLRKLSLAAISQRGMRHNLAMKFCRPAITACGF